MGIIFSCVLGSVSRWARSHWPGGVRGSNLGMGDLRYSFSSQCFVLSHSGNVFSRFVNMSIIRLLIPHSHPNLSCLRCGVDYPRFIDDDTAEELLTPLLR